MMTKVDFRQIQTQLEISDTNFYKGCTTNLIKGIEVGEKMGVGVDCLLVGRVVGCLGGLQPIAFSLPTRVKLINWLIWAVIKLHHPWGRGDWGWLVNPSFVIFLLVND